MAARVVVVAADGAWIEVVEPRGGCGRCQEPGGCGGISLLRWRGSERFWFPRTQWTAPLAEGMPVWVVTPSGVPLQAAWRAYGVPLLLGVAGAASVHWGLAGVVSLAVADGAAAVALLTGLGWGWRRAARTVLPVVQVVPRACA